MWGFILILVCSRVHIKLQFVSVVMWSPVVAASIPLNHLPDNASCQLWYCDTADVGDHVTLSRVFGAGQKCKRIKIWVVVFFFLVPNKPLCLLLPPQAPVPLPHPPPPLKTGCSAVGKSTGVIGCTEHSITLIFSLPLTLCLSSPPPPLPHCIYRTATRARLMSVRI